MYERTRELIRECLRILRQPPLVSSMEWANQYRVLDTTSGYRLADKAVIKQFAKRYPIKYPEPETIVHILKRKYKVLEKPANMFERTGGVSSITPIKSIRYMIEVCSSILIAAFMKESE